MERKGFIGGSDIASVMGLSRWKSALQLWAEKTGQLEPADLSDVEYVQLGSELEDFIAKKFQRETDLKVRRASKHYQHALYPYMRCQVDRIIERSEDLLECKTCSAWKAKEWEGEDVPQEYILQVMWQLGITGRKVGWIAVLIGGQRFRYKKILFDEKLFDSIVECAKTFWGMVQTNTPPYATGLDNPTIVKLNPYHNDSIEEVNDINDSVRYLQEVKMHIDDLKKEKDALEAKIKQRIGGNLGVSTGNYIVTWKHQLRNSVDTTALKADGLYERYSKSSETRVLRIKKDGAK